MGNIVNYFLFQPPDRDPQRLIKSPSDLVLQTKSGDNISCVYVENPGAKYTILYSHANAEDLQTIFRWLQYLARYLRVNIMAYDYPGYGLSTGDASENNCYEAIDACFEHLLIERGLSCAQIILYGRSLGSGPSCYMASKCNNQEYPIAALVLQSPFLSVLSVVGDFGPCGVVTDGYDQFPNGLHIKTISCPVLIIHGDNDKIIPLWHSKLLLQSVQSDTLSRSCFIKDMGHNQIDGATLSLMLQRVRHFIHIDIKYHEVKEKMSTLKQHVPAEEQKLHKVIEESPMKLIQ